MHRRKRNHVINRKVTCETQDAQWTTFLMSYIDKREPGEKKGQSPSKCHPASSAIDTKVTATPEWDYTATGGDVNTIT